MRLLVTARVRTRSASTCPSICSQICDTVGFGTPLSTPRALTRSSSLRVEGALDVGGHDHRPQGPGRPGGAAPAATGRSFRPGTWESPTPPPLPGLTGSGVAVALPRPVIGALAQGCAGPATLPRSASATRSGADREQAAVLLGQQVHRSVGQQVTIDVGHRVAPSRDPWKDLTNSHTVATPSGEPTPTYTCCRDSNSSRARMPRHGPRQE